MSVTTSSTPAADPATAAAPASPPVVGVELRPDPARLAGLGDLARDLERAGVGALILGDPAPGRPGLHPVHLAAHLAPLTRRVGLLARTDGVYVEPFHLATQLMSLDHLTSGRAGWLLRAATDPAMARAVGRDVLDGEQTAQEAADVLHAARRIWDTWAPDAVVRDTDRGLYLDAARLQYADVETETFSVRGPSITPRSPQGLLPVLVADADRAAAGETAARAADGRALDVDIRDGIDLDALTFALEGAVADAHLAAISGLQAPAAEPVRLVRLLGLEASGPDALDELPHLLAALRSRGLIAPAPPSGATLREQLGLPPAPYRADPARRADRARHPETAGTTATPAKETP